MKRKPLTQSELRRQWLTGLIRQVHVTSRGTCGYRRVHAELTMAMSVTVSDKTVFKLMHEVGIYGLAGPAHAKRLRGVVTSDDLVNRKFSRPRPNELWVTDITQHRTREGWVYCAAVLDAYSRRIIGWSIDSKQDTTLVINALDMAIRNCRPAPGGIVHADHGTQFTSWLFGEKIRSAGLLPSFGSVGEGLVNAMMESFWSSMQIELLNRKKWKTRVELANAIFEYIEIFHNRQRRHSALGYRTPIECETLEINDIPAASYRPGLEPNPWGRSTCHLSVQQSQRADDGVARRAGHRPVGCRRPDRAPGRRPWAGHRRHHWGAPCISGGSVARQGRWSVLGLT